MKIAKNKLVVIFLILVILLSFMISVKANDTKEYNLELIGMKIEIDNELIDIVSGIENNDERLANIENKEEYKQEYDKAGILIDALDNTDNQPSKEILVVAQTNSTYANMLNLNQFSNEDTNKYVEKVTESIKEQSGVQKIELVETKNGNTYVNVISNAQIEQKTINMSIYYTIMNGNLITISFRYYGENIQINEQEVIENIQFYEVQRPNYSTANLATRIAVGISFILIIILIIVSIIIRIKDRRLLDKNVDRKTRRYGKFGGLILFFWTMCFYQILLYIINIDQANKIENMMFYTTSIKIQNTILVLISIYQIYMILKRRDDTPKKVIKSNIFAIIVSAVIIVIRVIYAITGSLEIQYIKQELTSVLNNIVYPLIFIIYYVFSQRVQIYYFLPRKDYKEILKKVVGK